MDDDRCVICPLLICDPLNRLCNQTPEGKLELIRNIRSSNNSLANLKLGPKAFAAKMRKRKQAKNLEAVNAKRKFIASLGFKKYDRRRTRDVR